MDNKEALKVIEKLCENLKPTETVVLSAFLLACAALEKQIPRKVLLHSDGYADGYPVYDIAGCPKCGSSFEDGDENWESSYCPNCGQRLDWEHTDG